MGNIKDNIFDRHIGDATGYLVFNVIIPVFTSGCSLWSLSENLLAAVYCYFTLFISALSCIYDGANRLKGSSKSPSKYKKRKKKLLCIFVSYGSIAVYCIYFILATLITEEMACRFDYILFLYLVPFSIASLDFGQAYMLWDVTAKANKRRDKDRRKDKGKRK